MASRWVLARPWRARPSRHVWNNRHGLHFSLTAYRLVGVVLVVVRIHQLFVAGFTHRVLFLRPDHSVASKRWKLRVCHDIMSSKLGGPSRASLLPLMATSRTLYLLSHDAGALLSSCVTCGAVGRFLTWALGSLIVKRYQLHFNLVRNPCRTIQLTTTHWTLLILINRRQRLIWPKFIFVVYWRIQVTITDFK